MQHLTSKNFRGFNDLEEKDDAFSDEGNHIAVSVFNPVTVMAKVLLEPRTVVTDSNTYDITAYALCLWN